MNHVGVNFPVLVWNYFNFEQCSVLMSLPSCDWTEIMTQLIKIYSPIQARTASFTNRFGHNLHALRREDVAVGFLQLLLNAMMWPWRTTTDVVRATWGTGDVSAALLTRTGHLTHPGFKGPASEKQHALC